MRKQIITLAALITFLVLLNIYWVPVLHQPEPAKADVICQSTPIQYSGGATTLLVTAPKTTSVVNICGLTLVSTGVVNVTMVNGTGATCGTSTVTWSGQYNLIAQSGVARSYYPIISMPTGANVCLTESAGILVQGELDYIIFG